MNKKANDLGAQLHEVTAFTGTDKDGNPFTNSRRGHLKKRTAEVIAIREGWTNVSIFRNLHRIHPDGSNTRVKEGPEVVLDTTGKPSLAERTLARGKNRFVDAKP